MSIDLLRYGAVGIGQGLVNNILTSNKVSFEEPICIMRYEVIQQWKKDLEYANALIAKLRKQNRLLRTRKR